MSKINLDSVIDCSGMSLEKIDYEIKNLIFNKYKKIILRNAGQKENLLKGIKGNVKVEVLGDVGSDFANNVNGLKIIVNGNIGVNSVNNIENTKVTVFGSCSDNFANNIKSSEIYILGNCGKSSFLNLTSGVKILLGGLLNSNFASANNGGTVIALNLLDGNVFFEDDYFKAYKSGNLYLRCNMDKIKSVSEKFNFDETNENDEDIYLPLISEFARLFNLSLSELKSRQFWKISVKA